MNPQYYVSGVEESFSEFGVALQNFLPKIFLALLILLSGWIIGMIVERIFATILRSLLSSKLAQKTKIQQFIQHSPFLHDPEKVSGKFLKIIVFLFFVRIAANTVGWTQLQDFLTGVFALIPSAILSLLIIFFAVRYARTVERLTKTILKKEEEEVRNVVALITKNTMIAIGIVAALFQLDIAPMLMIVLFSSFLLLFSLAGGIALGMSGHTFLTGIINRNKEKNQISAKKREQEG